MTLLINESLKIIRFYKIKNHLKKERIEKKVGFFKKRIFQLQVVIFIDHLFVIMFQANMFSVRGRTAKEVMLYVGVIQDRFQFKRTIMIKIFDYL